MTDIQLRELAKRGAEVRVQELETELRNLRALFPEFGTQTQVEESLDLDAPARRLTPASSEAEPKKRGWSSASRAAMSIRQKALWAKRKADAAAKTKRPRGRPPKQATV